MHVTACPIGLGMVLEPNNLKSNPKQGVIRESGTEKGGGREHKGNSNQMALLFDQLMHNLMI